MRIRVSPLDKLSSEFIRRRAIKRAGGCERCGAPKIDFTKDDGSIYPAWKQLQCSHYHGRGKKSVRWDEDNAAGLCFGCHQHFGANPLEHTEWFKARLGAERFDLLLARARVTYPRPDEEAIGLYLKEKIRLLEEVSDESNS